MHRAQLHQRNCCPHPSPVRGGAPTVLDDPEYHADVKRGVVVVAHAVGTDGSLSLSLRTPNAAAGLGVGGVCV